MRKARDLIELFELLDDYNAYSQQVILTNLILNIKKQIYMIPDNIYIPKESQVYYFLNQKFPEIKFVYHPNPQIDVSERKIDKFLDSISDKNIFKLKKVIYLPMNKIYETGGLSSYLFVSEDYAKQENWKKNLVSASKNTLLIPVDVKNDYFYEYLDEIKYPHSENFINIVRTLIMTWIAKTQNLNFVYPEDRRCIMYLVNIQNKDENSIISLITHFNNKISNIDFNYSYGSSHQVYVNTKPIVFMDKFSKNYEVDDVINEEYFAFLKTLNIKLAHWYIDIWMNKPHGTYIIPSHLIFDIEAIYSEESTGKVRPEFIRELINGIKECITEAEILTFLHIMYTYDKNYNGENDKGIGKFCLRQIRNRASSNELTEMAIAVFLGYVDRRTILIQVINPILISLNLYAQKRIIFHIKEEPSRNGFTFTCKALISYIYNIPDLVTMTNESLNSVQKYSETFSPSSVKLQIVEIAINEGTTKNYIQAVLTELVQNSIDAIRSSQSNGEIRINLHTDSITITDNIGIPESSMMALLIPFLSSKNPNDPNVTGEMGTGFFNVYRQPLCKMVRIESNRIIIEAIPLLKDKMVENIQYSISTQNEVKGTSITIFFNPKLDNIIESITDAHLYTTNFLGFTGIKTYLDDNLIEEKRSLILNSSIGSVYVTANTNIQSFVMTNNIPFAPLSVFTNQFPDVYQRFLSEGNTRIIFNFNKSVYTPSQSRTKVNIPFNLRTEISNFINDGLYLSILYMYNNGEINHQDSIIDNSTSRANISQLKFSTAKVLYDISSHPAYKKEKLLADLYINYVPTRKVNNWMNNRSLSFIINEYINSLSITDLKLPLFDDIISLAVLKWTSNKNLSLLKKETIEFLIEGPGEETKENVAVSVPFEILQPFIDLYWKICKELTENNIIQGLSLKSPPQVVIGNTANKNLKGFYSANQNIIFFNEEKFSLVDITQKIKTKPTVYEMRVDPLMASLFSPSLPVPTLIHEILHALQNEDHTVSSHGITNILVNGVDELSFDDCANVIYQEVLKKGIMEEFLRIT